MDGAASAVTAMTDSASVVHQANVGSRSQREVRVVTTEQGEEWYVIVHLSENVARRPLKLYMSNGLQVLRGDVEPHEVVPEHLRSSLNVGENYITKYCLGPFRLPKAQRQHFHYSLVETPRTEAEKAGPKGNLKTYMLEWSVDMDGVVLKAGAIRMRESSMQAISHKNFFEALVVNLDKSRDECAAARAALADRDRRVAALEEELVAQREELETVRTHHTRDRERLLAGCLDVVNAKKEEIRKVHSLNEQLNTQIQHSQPTAHHHHDAPSSSIAMADIHAPSLPPDDRDRDRDAAPPARKRGRPPKARASVAVKREMDEATFAEELLADDLESKQKQRLGMEKERKRKEEKNKTQKEKQKQKKKKKEEDNGIVDVLALLGDDGGGGSSDEDEDDDYDEDEDDDDEASYHTSDGGDASGPADPLLDTLIADDKPPRKKAAKMVRRPAQRRVAVYSDQTRRAAAQGTAGTMGTLGAGTAGAGTSRGHAGTSKASTSTARSPARPTRSSTRGPGQLEGNEAADLINGL